MGKNYNTKHLIQLIIFWINVILISVSAFALYISKGPDFVATVSTNVTFERYTIILTLAIIPLTLKLFHGYYQKISLLEQSIFIKKYLFASYLRIFLFDCVAILNLGGFYMYDSMNLLYLTIMIIFALFFCYPNKKVLQNIKTSDNPENIN